LSLLCRSQTDREQGGRKGRRREWKGFVAKIGPQRRADAFGFVQES